MGERDRVLLDAAGLSYAKAAKLLHLGTRQALHHRVKSDLEYLDEDRLTQLYRTLTDSEDMEDKPRAKNLATMALQRYQINLDELIRRHERLLRDYYCIFSPHPFELQNDEYLVYMTTEVFTKATLVAYFMGRDSNVDQLIGEIEQQQKEPAAKHWKANLYIIKSNLVEAMPHIALTRVLDGGWEGCILDLKERPFDFESLNDTYVHRLTTFLRFAGFSILPHHDATSFFPKGKCRVSYHGIEFENVTPQEWRKRDE